MGCWNLEAKRRDEFHDPSVFSVEPALKRWVRQLGRKSYHATIRLGLVAKCRSLSTRRMWLVRSGPVYQSCQSAPRRWVDVWDGRECLPSPVPSSRDFSASLFSVPVEYDGCGCLCGIFTPFSPPRIVEFSLRIAISTSTSLTDHGPPLEVVLLSASSTLLPSPPFTWRDTKRGEAK